jgi:RNA polymerase sigma-70 factor, ECF subfamily
MESQPIASVVSDHDCLRRYAAGDDAAFALLYDRYDRQSWDYLRRMLHPPDPAAAQDLHQETWLAVARAASTFDPAKARFVTWLFTIARNKLMDHLRHRTTVLRLVAEPADEADAHDLAAADVSWQPEQRLASSQAGRAVIDEVSRLPHPQREAFILFALEDLSLQEIAGVCGVGAETVKSRIRYARNTLRTRLEAWRHADV